MAFLGHINENVEETGYWEILGAEDYTYANFFDDALTFPLPPLDPSESRHVLIDLCVFHKPGRGSAARVTWTIINVPTRPGPPPPFPVPQSLDRDGVRVLVPKDPLLEPIFYIFHRWRDILLSPRITVAIQFYEASGGGPTRKLRASIVMTPLARRRFASCSQTVQMQIHAFEPAMSDDDADDNDDDDDDDDADADDDDDDDDNANDDQATGVAGGVGDGIDALAGGNAV